MLHHHEGQLIAGKYRLKRLLAKGGMGSVWTASHISLDVPVAVKFMDPRYADMDDLRGRFEREAKAAAQLRMPNVVQILDYGVEEGTPYIVMEFLTGEDLGARLAREGRLAVRDAVPILTQVCKALKRAHEEGIIHRDLKPANVFLAEQDGDVLVKVLDFGIAKVMRPDVAGDTTKTGEILGSPPYMSPEQVRGLREIDHRSDLWSLGVIVYRAVTGELPFPGTQVGDILVKICVDHPIPPTKIVPDLDPRIDDFMTKALAKDPSLRFATVKELADALAELDRGEQTKSPYRSATLGTNVDGATNAPVMNNVVASQRKTTKTFVRWMAICGASAVVLLILVMYWVSRPPVTAASAPLTPISLDAGIASASIPEMAPAKIPSAHPMISASAPATVEPPSAANSSKMQSLPRKTNVPTAPKASANYSLRKEL